MRPDAQPAQGLRLRRRARTPGGLLLLILATTLGSCKPAQQPVNSDHAISDAARSSGQSRRTGEAHGLALIGYNYTDLPMSSYSVAGAWGGDLHVSGEDTGGGKITCCASLPRSLPAKYLVRWSRNDHRWCELEVTFAGPIPDNARFFNTHFFEDGHIEITLSHDIEDPLLKLSNFGDGMSRKATGNVVMDEKVARCKDVI